MAGNPDSVKLREVAGWIGMGLSVLGRRALGRKIMQAHHDDLLAIADRLDALWAQTCSDPWECCIPEHNSDPEATERASRGR